MGKYPRQNFTSLVQEISDNSSPKPPTKHSRFIDDEPSEAGPSAEEVLFIQPQYGLTSEQSVTDPLDYVSQFGGLLVDRADSNQNVCELQPSLEHLLEPLHSLYIQGILEEIAFISRIRRNPFLSGVMVAVVNAINEALERLE